MFCVPVLIQLPGCVSEIPGPRIFALTMLQNVDKCDKVGCEFCPDFHQKMMKCYELLQIRSTIRVLVIRFFFRGLDSGAKIMTSVVDTGAKFITPVINSSHQ